MKLLWFETWGIWSWDSRYFEESQDLSVLIWDQVGIWSWDFLEVGIWNPIFEIKFGPHSNPDFQIFEESRDAENPTLTYSTYGIANQRMEYEIELVQIFHLHLRAQPRTIGF